ncbi:MAG: hypothetical protein ACP5OR_06635 [Candidatus Dormibacteria bacterium]
MNQPSTASDLESEHDLIPLLPQGIPVFENIPAKAVILEALAPALGHGVMVIRKEGAVGVILVKSNAIIDVYCFSGGHRFLGDVALKRIKSLSEATVTAHKLEEDVVDVIPSVLRGDLCYDDLRLAWTNWPALLQDMLSREGTYIIEVSTPKGRGVTCIVDGHQVATYTEDHPILGDPTLLDALFRGSQGTMRIRRAALVQTPPTAPQIEPVEEVADDDEEVSGKPAPAESGQLSSDISYDALFSLPEESGTEDVDSAPEDVHDSSTVSAPTPSMSPLNEHLDEFKSIARDHLQRSAARVVNLLDDAAAQNKPLDEVFTDIRGLVIRGVMQSTLDEVVAKMEKAVSS